MVGCHVSVRGVEAEAVVGAAIDPSKRKSRRAGEVVGDVDGAIAAT
jgi:hypothetical protein